MKKCRLLVSVRGKNDTIEAVKGGAHIIDAENPGSALGTCYPANIYTIRHNTPKNRQVSTNIGEKQFIWSTAGQAAVGVACAGADIIKVGLATLNENLAKKVMRDVTKQVRFFFKNPPKVLISTFFADDSLRNILDPVSKGAKLSEYAKADGVLIDTFDKNSRKGILDWMKAKELKTFAKECHKSGQEAWLAGSITLDQIPILMATDVDVICVRGAACIHTNGERRLGKVSSSLVAELVAALKPKSKHKL